MVASSSLWYLINVLFHASFRFGSVLLWLVPFVVDFVSFFFFLSLCFHFEVHTSESQIIWATILVCFNYMFTMKWQIKTNFLTFNMKPSRQCACICVRMRGCDTNTIHIHDTMCGGCSFLWLEFNGSEFWNVTFHFWFSSNKNKFISWKRFERAPNILHLYLRK